jgi:uncharacterized lipoprotein YmbA
MNPRIRQTLAGTGLILILAGCAAPSQTTRFYRLDQPAPGAAMPVTAPGKAAPPLVGIGAVNLPGYLDRPQLVERGADHRLTLHEFDQWAGGLRENIQQVMRDELQRSLTGARVIAYPWRGGVHPNYELELNVSRFERQGAQVRLEARWSLFGAPGGKLLLLERSSIETPLEGSGVETMVAASAEAVRRLAREIAVYLDGIVRASAPE